ncbi:MAG: ABC transporter ATP-binding protein [Lachnospiraceae bacterium]
MNKNKNSLLRLLNYGGGLKWLTIFSCIFSCISTAFTLLPFLCLWKVANVIFQAFPTVPDFREISPYGWYAVLAAAASIIFYLLSLLCSHITAFRVSRNMKSTALAHLLKLPLGFFSSSNSGKLRKTIDDNTELTEAFLSHQLPNIAASIFFPIAVIILLFQYDWILGIVCMIPIVLAIVCLASVLNKKNMKLMKTYQDSLERMSDEAVEYVRGIPVVKVFQQTIYSFRSFNASVREYSKYAEYFVSSSKVSSVLADILLSSAFAFLIPAGILLFASTSDPAKFIMDFIFYIFFTPACTVMYAKLKSVAESTMAASEVMQRMDLIFAEKPLEEPDEPKTPGNNDISLEDVSFTYTGSEQPAVKHVSFFIPDGQTIALVGASGGGKSTIAALIARFFDADQGTVKIGGVDVRNIRSQELMERISFVFQNTNLFKGTLLDNIKIGRENASGQEVLQALEDARCIEIIEKLPNGIHTVIGQDGTYLSGGECQRIALARAILKNAPIVLLDEATAFVDPESELEIQKAIGRLTVGKTVLIVAHRLTTVTDADRILVIQGGRIQEQGTHGELLNQKGIYAAMCNEYQKTIEWNVEVTTS